MDIPFVLGIMHPDDDWGPNANTNATYGEFAATWPAASGDCPTEAAMIAVWDGIDPEVYEDLLLKLSIDLHSIVKINNYTNSVVTKKTYDLSVGESKVISSCFLKNGFYKEIYLSSHCSKSNNDNNCEIELRNKLDGSSLGVLTVTNEQLGWYKNEITSFFTDISIDTEVYVVCRTLNKDTKLTVRCVNLDFYG